MLRTVVDNYGSGKEFLNKSRVMKTHALADKLGHSKKTSQNRQNSENHKRYGHYGRGFVHAAFRLVVHSCFSLKGKHVEPRHVKSGQYGRKEPRSPEKRMAAVIKRSQDLILAEKPGEKREAGDCKRCLLYTSPSPRDRTRSRMPSSA